jgi:hypothetical protein
MSQKGDIFDCLIRYTSYECLRKRHTLCGTPEMRQQNRAWYTLLYVSNVTLIWNVSNGNETATVIYDETILLSVELSNKIPYAILDNFCFCQHFATTFGSQKKKKKKKKKDRKHSMIVSNGGTHVDYYVCNHSIRTFFSTFFFLQIGKLTL